MNVALPTHQGDRVARVFTRRFAPALMLLMDRADSPGLLVRPRPERLEFGAEYVSDVHLRAAAAFAAGSVLAITDGASTASSLPPRVRVHATRAVERYGLYVDRSAFGVDLYADGRATRLRRERGGTITAQEHLEEAWQPARRALRGIASDDDLDAVDRLVTGALPLPLEVSARDELLLPTSCLASPLGGVLDARVRPGYAVRAVIATWTFTVFALERAERDRPAFCCIPLDVLSDFLDELDAGALDQDLLDFLESAPSGRILDTVGQTSEPGLYDEVGGGHNLLPRERDPISGRPLSGGGSGASGERPGKSRARRMPRPRARWLVVLGVALAVILGAVLIAVAAGGGSDEQRAIGSAAQKRTTSTTSAGAAASPTTTRTREPSGGTSQASSVIVQDGTYTITNNDQLSPARVHGGDKVVLHENVTSVGPSWTKDATTGEWQRNCTLTSVTISNPDTSSTQIILIPRAQFNGELAASAKTSARATPPGATSISAPLVVASATTSPSGSCDVTSSRDLSISFSIPLSLAPGEYAVVPAASLISSFPDAKGVIAFSSGDFTVLTVLQG